MDTRLIAALTAAGALVALPATGVADPGKGGDKAKGKTQSQSKSKRCKKAPKVGFTVRGTLVSATADNPMTPENEGTVTITVTGANSHAKKSGDLTDQDATKPGTQVEGGTYTVPATDAHKLNLVGYEAPDTPSVGDAVKITGKVPVTKKKCAAAGTSEADRYGTVDVRKVTITDSDPDA